MIARDATAQSTALQQQYADMRAGYLDRLADRCLEIEGLLQLVDRSGPTEPLRREIAHRAHKTAGVAPTLGFEKLGAIAKRVEAAWSHEFRLDLLVETIHLSNLFLDQIEIELDQF